MSAHSWVLAYFLRKGLQERNFPFNSPSAHMYLETSKLQEIPLL